MADYITWSNPAEKRAALASLGASLQKTRPLRRASAANTYLDVAPFNVSVRDSFTREDYEEFRPDEALPRRPKDVMRECMRAYHRHAILRNVIDLMSDFGAKGIDISHPNERIERFYQEWFRVINGPERSERFLNLLYRCGNVFVRRHFAEVSAEEEERIRRGMAGEADLSLLPAYKPREIPLRYSFLNPLSVNVLHEQLAPFIGPQAFMYSITVPDELARVIQFPKSAAERKMAAMIPTHIKTAIKGGGREIDLPEDRVSAFYYKRDDWQAWSIPMVFAILPDLQMLEKLKLADMAALDGAISSIRVWKLGSLEHELMPNDGVINRLAEMLCNNVGGGVMDLVWGPDIELVETSTDVHQFLGEEKYRPHLQNIFQGLGVPSTLAGEQQGGFTNNYLSLKTLTERLEYGRNLLQKHWEHEIRLVQQAMDFRYPATIAFDNLLTDEAAEKRLILELADRALISVESCQEMFGLTPEIEAVRMRREERKRQKGHMPRRAGPFHDANHAEAMEKIFAGTGAYAPSEFGMVLDERLPDDKAPKEVDAELAPPAQEAALPGEPGQGRPEGVKDSFPRKKKKVKPRSTGRLEVMQRLSRAVELQTKIAQLTGPPYLQSLGKKNLRELTDQEALDFESFKLAVLCSLPLDLELTSATLENLLDQPLTVPPVIQRVVQTARARFVQERGKEPTLEMMRGFQAYAWALFAEGRVSGDAASALPRAEQEPAPPAPVSAG